MDMDFREQPRPQPQAQAPARHDVLPPTAKRDGGGSVKSFFKFLLLIILIGATGAGAYLWRDKEAKDKDKLQSSEISQLQQQVSQLQSELKGAQDEATKTGPSADTLKKVQDAVKVGKYSDMESLIASKVSVIIAASEGLGSRTPAQAVSDMKYLDSGTDPWDFALPAATISGYQDGDYAQHFPVGALVGKAANNYVVSFVFNNSGKITGIFMASNADLL